MPWSDDPLNNVPKQSFEDAARLAAELCRTAQAVICLHDAGIPQVHASYTVAEASRRLPPVACAEVPVPERLLVVPDLRLDPAYRDGPLARAEAGTRFYAAVPLKTAQGEVLGTLCLLDPAPRPEGLTEAQGECLCGLGRQVVTLLELRRAGQRYRDQKLLQERILGSATDYAIIAMDRNGHVTRWNAGAERVLGWREDEILGDPAHVIFTPEDRMAGRPETEMALALRDGSAPDERWHLRKGGERFWANGEMMPLRDERGTTQGFLKIVRDRTKQRADDATLHKVQDQLHLAVAATDIGIFDYDLATGDLGWDARVCALFGLPPDAEVGYEVFLAGLHPGDRDWVDQAVKATLDPAGDGTYDIAYRTIGLTDGVERWISAKGQAFFEQGRPVRFIGTVRDITESRQAEQTLRETEERYRLAARATNDAIWDWNLHTDHIRWNDAVRTLFGYAPEEVGPSGKWWTSRIHPDDRERIKTSIHAAIDGATENWTEEYRFLRADGSHADILDRGYVLRDEGGKAVRMIGAMLDITERKKAEKHQRLLTAELQHRVKNTLAMVQAIASQTLRGATDIDEAREAFSARLISLGRAHDILTQASWTAAPIVDVVEGALSVHRQADASRIRVNGPNVLLGAKPALSLALALHELATNAAKYGALSTANGAVDLRWHVVHEGEQPRFCLTWTEQGGPPILSQPTRRGFGSRLIERSFASEVGGEVRLTYAPTGLVCRLEAPLASMQEPREAVAA
ncbi:PAS domain S-box protein [Methylobacterium komagatae]|uniref:Blue-light-activated histidine kinase n=1 Tax=Methylobacterium komagatae TaxID=374425 RepID=A0ABW2BIK7_9HYPH|nr:MULTISPECIES: PAS domain S-box protein [Methylobacterium]MDE3744304.1 PAS domain S-box protein [Methylobacterium radiotolerans]MWV22559.1 PAS domain S-box protein [Methylobacterium sp. 2A]PVZ07155.1 PAS domain S-box-containing protein [Methylobacterium organophilum]